jgi:DNA-directed RNA polymerase specialized sigma24 family protein
MTEASSPQHRSDPELLDPHDELRWAEVDARFRQALRIFAIRLGLSDADADDVAQESLAALACAARTGDVQLDAQQIQRYLFGVARRRVALAIRRRYGAVGKILSATDTWIDTLPATDRERAVWEQTWAVSNLTRALDLLRTRCDPSKLRMFILRVRARKSIRHIARLEGVNPLTVYRAVDEIKFQLHRLLKGSGHGGTTA